MLARNKTMSLHTRYFWYSRNKMYEPVFQFMKIRIVNYTYESIIRSDKINYKFSIHFYLLILRLIMF